MLKETLFMFGMCILSAIFNIKPTHGQDKICTPLTKLRGPHPGGVCGNSIDEVLDMLCINGHNELYPSKRKKRGLSDEIKKELQNILIKRTEAVKYLSKRDEFHESGIVCECCYNQCSFSELYSYCKAGDSMYKRTINTAVNGN